MCKAKFHLGVSAVLQTLGLIGCSSADYQYNPGPLDETVVQQGGELPHGITGNGGQPDGMARVLPVVLG